MTAPAAQSAVSHDDRRIAETRGAVESSLVTSPAQENLRKWRRVIDRLLSWRSNPGLLEYAEVPTIDPARLESAIDLAYDLRSAGGDAPTSIAPSVDGGIAFEWRNADRLEEWSGQLPGRWEVTVLESGRVQEHFFMERDPRTRRLEQSPIQL